MESQEEDKDKDYQPVSKRPAKKKGGRPRTIVCENPKTLTEDFSSILLVELKKIEKKNK